MHPPELQDGGWDSSGVADPGIGGICPEGRCSPTQQGRQTQRPKFWQSLQQPLATTGASLLCSPRSTAGGREWGRV